MAGLITPSDITWNGKEVQALSEAIITKAYLKPALSDLHTLVPGIVAKTQIAFLGRLGLVGKTSTGCTPDTNTSTIVMSQKYWDPAYIEDRFVQCWKDLRNSFFIWGLQKGLKKADLTNTDFWNFLEDILTDAVEEAVLRLVWFGDKAAGNYNASPAGVITNGVNVAYFNPIDGFWVQIFAAVAAASGLRAGTVTKNSAASFALQAFDSTDTTNKVVSGYFRSLITKADYRLRDQPGIRILCTQSMFDQYVTELESTGLNPSFDVITNGITSLKRSGIEIVGVNFWDRYILAYESNGTKAYLPHRALLTTSSNLQIGTEEEANLSELTTYYDPKVKDFTVDFGFNLDAKLVENYLMEVIY